MGRRRVVLHSVLRFSFWGSYTWLAMAIGVVDRRAAGLHRHPLAAKKSWPSFSGTFFRLACWGAAHRFTRAEHS